MSSVLLVEDEQALRRSMRRRLELDGYVVFETQNIAVALSLVRDNDPEIVITDINLGTENGIDLVHQLRDLGYRGGIIVITAYGTIDNAVNAVRNGADEFVQKPISLEELMLVVERTTERRRIANRLQLYERIDRFTNLQQNEKLIGQSENWLSTLNTAQKAARASSQVLSECSTILLQGDTGTGKETLAQYIHRHEQEKPGPFVHVKCFALPDPVLENELFGSTNGSLSQTAPIHRGLFEAARGGSVFLDEISEMPVSLQSKLLALLAELDESAASQDKQNPAANIRILASTSQNLHKRIEDNSFRRDLFFRLSTLTITLPPLVDREDDVILLAKHFLKTMAGERGRSGLSFTPDALNALRNHNWPGNVQELRNAVQRAIMLSDGSTISAQHLALRTDNPLTNENKPNTSENNTIPDDNNRAQSRFVTVTDPKYTRFEFVNGPINADDIEKNLIIAAVQETGGNISRAAKLIGMTRSGLRYRIERYQLRHLVEEMVS